MGWRLTKEIDTPNGIAKPCQLIKLEGHSGYWDGATWTFWEGWMKIMPDYFEFTPDLPEGWVRPEDTDAEYGWVMIGYKHIVLAQKHKEEWYMPCNQSPMEDYLVKAIYPLQKPKI